MASLWKNGANFTINQDVYNDCKRIRRADLGVSTSIEELLDRLQTSGYLHRADFGEERRVSRLFFASPDAVELTRRFNTAFVADCTYKKNGYNMQVLHIVEMTCTNRSFNACFPILSGETQVDYE
ncbi:hypothetical protein PsorP6_006711 [Peronosclerospora sorghi]|uniref:Uncharacterized protein n=1 Tax=Peronosclerospora sorghi TaxID=230839 RepID=A0ACC0W598_9STRA|nr:hypothetical protein PsorP6_006711 [Peronosclerospora sorghi]